ncbi:MAG: hypothetical protein J6S14_15670 [Clostridia bacterium]|nr:hypothetical protein [Clostridia bacterium]
MYIQIWYSRGDQESPVEVPEKYREYPLEYALILALEEIRVSTFEAECDYHALMVNSEEQMVTLYYGNDSTYCYYKVTEEEDFDPKSNI